MKTLKLASKYFLMLATFCILSENYLCSIIVTEEDPKYIPKDSETTRWSTTTRRTKFQQNSVHLRETKQNKSDICTKNCDTATFKKYVKKNAVNKSEFKINYRGSSVPA